MPQQVIQENHENNIMLYHDSAAEDVVTSVTVNVSNLFQRVIKKLLVSFGTVDMANIHHSKMTPYEIAHCTVTYRGNETTFRHHQNK